jgi:hypothetical protein
VAPPTPGFSIPNVEAKHDHGIRHCSVFRPAPTFVCRLALYGLAALGPSGAALAKADTTPPSMPTVQAAATIERSIQPDVGSIASPRSASGFTSRSSTSAFALPARRPPSSQRRTKGSPASRPHGCRVGARGDGGVGVERRRVVVNTTFPGYGQALIFDDSYSRKATYNAMSAALSARQERHRTTGFALQCRLENLVRRHLDQTMLPTATPAGTAGAMASAASRHRCSPPAFPVASSLKESSKLATSPNARPAVSAPPPSRSRLRR